VGQLVESISRVGLLTPITVHDEGERVWLVAGHHRLAAMKKLGWDMADVFVIYGDDIEIELREIAENLHREDLTHLERDDHLARWIELTDVKDKLAQLAPVSGGRGNEGGLRAVTRELGVERTDVQRAIKVASLSPEAKAAAVEHGLDDNRSALLAAAKEKDPEKQVAVIKERAVKPVKKPDEPLNDIESPEVLEDNMLHVLGGMNENARIFNKFFKISAFDREAASRIVAAIDKTIGMLRSVQSTLQQKE
jgi:ParB family chromosome partitioning protein